MAIVNSASTFTGVGNEVIQVLGAVITTAGSPQTVRLPAAGSITPPVVRGYLRTKVYNATVAASLTVITVQAGDGTNLVTIAEFGPAVGVAITATTWVDIIDDFIVDSVASASAGGAAGALIFGGATFFNFIFTLTGAGGSCSADCEIAAQP